jgi:hypothetical protein
MPGSVSSAACWSVMSICSPPTAPSSISPASGLPCADVYETRSSLAVVDADSLMAELVSLSLAYYTAVAAKEHASPGLA